jgi:AcrR family transcriptional regulator
LRALTDAERAQRRDDLAQTAADLFRETGYPGLTMDLVARTAGVAKGSVFLAFATKEELVLHAVKLRFAAWFDRLMGLDPRRPSADLSRDLLASLRSDPLLLPLLALVGPVLEHGCSQAAVVDFKEALAVNLRALAQRWAVQVPGVAPERWAPWFLQFYALTVGAWAVGEASATVRDALVGQPELQFLLTKFEDLFVPLAEAQIRILFAQTGAEIDG